MKKYILIIIFSLPLLPAAAEITVEITDIELGEGMAQLESMVNLQTADAAYEIETLIDTFTVKPLLFEAMSNANTATASLLPLSKACSGDFALFSGSSASFTTETWDFAALFEELGEFAIEDDLYLGAALQSFSAYFVLPADFLLDGLSFTAGAGWMAFDYDAATISSANLHLSSSCTFFRDESERAFKWTGLNLQAGITLSDNTVAVVYSIDDISQTFEIDADGTGPLVPFYVTISLSPDVGVTYRNTQFSIPGVLSTGVNIIDTFTFTIGGGAALTFGENSIGIDVNDEITVEGFLADLIETAPSIIVSGSETGTEAELLSAFVFGAFGFNAGNFTLNLPVCWGFEDTLTAGITVGARF